MMMTIYTQYYILSGLFDSSENVIMTRGDIIRMCAYIIFGNETFSIAKETFLDIKNFTKEYMDEQLQGQNIFEREVEEEEEEEEETT